MCPFALSSNSTIHIFKDGIKPMREDPSSRDDGQWVVRLPKAFSPVCWENLVLEMLGEQSMVGDEICGAGVSTREHEPVISLWIRMAVDETVTTKIREIFKRVPSLPHSTVFEYKKAKILSPKTSIKGLKLV